MQLADEYGTTPTDLAKRQVIRFGTIKKIQKKAQLLVSSTMPKEAAILTRRQQPRQPRQPYPRGRSLTALVASLFGLQFSIWTLVCKCGRMAIHLLLEPPNHPSGRPPRALAIRISHERFHVFISHHLHDPGVYAVKLAWVDRENLVLDRPDVRIAILDRRALSRPI